MDDATPARNLRLVLEYDGTDYVGWERQKNGLGIQEVVEEAVRTITQEVVVVEASGRTDAGVHAFGQVASFLLKKDIHLEKLRRGLNAVLPPDVAVLEVSEAPSGFHARKSAKSKLYRYSIWNDRVRRPHLRFRAYHVPMPLNAEVMHRAVQDLVGTHDFQAFAREADRKKSCVRTIFAATVRSASSLVEVELLGSGFLYNMVRIVTGTAIEIGLSRRPRDDFGRILAKGRREDSGYTVPPHGLCLVRVDY